jgi:amino acid transporter
VTGEMRNPTRDLARVVHTAMPLIILFYLLANMAYIFVLPFVLIESTNTIAVLFGSQVFGPIGSLVLSLTVSLSCFGALNATTFTSGRLVYAAGKEGFIPEVFGRLGMGTANAAPDRLRTKNIGTKALEKVFGDENGYMFQTPVNAMVLNMLLTTAYVLVGDFSGLLTFYGVAGYTFYFLTVLGLIVLRIKEPHLERPYKTWISTPIIFCCVSLFLISRGVFGKPVQSVVVLLFILAGVPVYFWRLRIRDGASEGEGWKFWKSGGRR